MERTLDYTFAVCIILILFSLSMVCAKVTKLYLELKQPRRGNGGMTERRRAELDRLFRCVRATFIQAISYIMALFITVMPHFLLNVWPKLDDTYIHVVALVTYPLQGLFNFVIFVGAKVYHLRRTDSELSFKKALHEIIFKISFEDDAEAMVLSGTPSGIGARDSVQPSVESLKLPYGTCRSTGEGSRHCSNVRISMNESRDNSLSIGAWDDISWASQSDNGSRVNLSKGLSEAPSENLSHNLSRSTSHTENLHDGLSVAPSIS